MDGDYVLQCDKLLWQADRLRQEQALTERVICALDQAAALSTACQDQTYRNTKGLLGKLNELYLRLSRAAQDTAYDAKATYSVVENKLIQSNIDVSHNLQV